MAKLTRREARGIAAEMLESGFADPPRLYDGGGMQRRLWCGEGAVGADVGRSP